jgi:hypothetical protein
MVSSASWYSWQPWSAGQFAQPIQAVCPADRHSQTSHTAASGMVMASPWLSRLLDFCSVVPQPLFAASKDRHQAQPERQPTTPVYWLIHQQHPPHPAHRRAGMGRRGGSMFRQVAASRRRHTKSAVASISRTWHSCIRRSSRQHCRRHRCAEPVAALRVIRSKDTAAAQASSSLWSLGRVLGLGLARFRDAVRADRARHFKVIAVALI